MRNLLVAMRLIHTSEVEAASEGASAAWDWTDEVGFVLPPGSTG